MQATVAAPSNGLEERLWRGADLLWDLEQRGETGAEYSLWLDHWLHLLQQYEGKCAS